MTNVLPPLQLSIAQQVWARACWTEDALIGVPKRPGVNASLVLLEYLYSLESPPEQPRPPRLSAGLGVQSFEDAVVESIMRSQPPSPRALRLEMNPCVRCGRATPVTCRTVDGLVVCDGCWIDTDGGA